jgi:Mrp family chromosome partitioning ATPase
MPPPRLVFVTGKGGTGKSTVAAAVAMELARRRPTMLVDLDQRNSAARMLGISEQNAQTVTGLTATTLTPRAELETFIRRMVPIGAISRRMLKSRTFGYVTAALPGLEAFLMLERLRLLGGDAALRDQFIVVDAPATGHALELLAVARSIMRLAPSGTLNRLAHNVDEFLRDSARFGVVLTLKPNELALREALDALPKIRTGNGVNAIIAMINCVPSAIFSAADMMKLEALPEHAYLARQRRDLVHAASRARRELTAAGVTVTELPMLFADAIGRHAIARMSEAVQPALAAMA